jgi:hypothetical protein
MTFEALAHRIAAAGAAEEAIVFAEVRAELGLAGATAACSDAAMALHRALLPDNGFQFGETPTRRGLASSWRAGDAHTTPVEAATPALALLRATAHAVARRHERQSREACRACDGRGWTIARDGGKRICRHAPIPERLDPLKRPTHDPVAQQDRAADS